MASEGQPGSPDASERRGFLDRHWDRFRRQQVDDPVEERTEGYWDRFKRQQVDDPVDARRDRGQAGGGGRGGGNWSR